jgi:outer membrane protein assembly factor BamE
MQKWLIIISITMLSACSNFNFPGVYKIDIQQGNIIEADMVEQLKPGMTKSQVRYVMGTPMVTDTFNQHRWDYFYQLKRGNGDLEKKHLSLSFNGDLLENIDQSEELYSSE